MLSDSSSELSAEEKLARKLAAQELAKYCQEFSCWRRTKRGRAIMDKPLPAPGTLGSPPMKESDPPAPHSSA